MRPLHLLHKTFRLHQWLELPAMTWHERSVVKRVLRNLAAQQPLDIFEYGSGFSTTYFANYLRHRGIAFHLDTIDNHGDWYQRVSATITRHRLNAFVTQHLCVFPPCWDKQGFTWAAPPPLGKFAPQSSAEIEYVQKPALLKRRFDVIFVDGRFRRRCLEMALDCLKPNGVAILHDAEETRYHDPLRKFNHSVFINSGPYFPFERRRHLLWIGSPDNDMVTRLR